MPPWKRYLCPATRLNGEGSEKDTRHVVFDHRRRAASATRRATASASSRRTIRRWPTPYLAALRVPPDFPVGGKPIRDALIEDYALGLAPDMLFELMSYLVGGERRQKAKLLAKGEDPDGDAADARRAGGAGKICAGAS